MRFVRYIPLMVLLTGCSVERGQVDFVHPPLFQLSLGDYRALIFFKDSTVLRMGGSYYTLTVPFWILPALVVGCLALAAWIIYRRPRYGKDAASYIPLILMMFVVSPPSAQRRTRSRCLMLNSVSARF